MIDTMMEIPSGKWCEGDKEWCCFFRDACPFDDAPEEPTFIDETLLDGTVQGWERSPKCCAAYPNGAVIEIKPK